MGSINGVRVKPIIIVCAFAYYNSPSRAEFAVCVNLPRRAGESGFTLTARTLGKILLMLFFGVVERRRELDLRGDPAMASQRKLLFMARARCLRFAELLIC